MKELCAHGEKWNYLKAAVTKEQASQKQLGGSGPVKGTSFKEFIPYIIGDRRYVVQV